MGPIDTSDVNEALILLADLSANRPADIQQNPPHPLVDSDEESTSTCPVSEKFYDDGGSSDFKNLTNVLPHLIEELWDLISDNVDEFCKDGRGRKPQVSAKDSFLMTLAVLKHVGQ